MSLSPKQIAALNAWGSTQEFAAYGQVDGSPASSQALSDHGTLFDSGKMLNDNLRDEYIWTVIQPTASATIDTVLFTAPMAGTIQSISLVAPTNLATTTTAADGYTAAVRKYNTGVTANLTVAYDLKTGLAGGVTAILPTNASNTTLALLTVTSTTVSVGVSSANLTLTSTGAFVNQPAVNDYLSIAQGATNVAGATQQNSGIYLITAVDPAGLWLTAAKQFGANPQAVSAVAVAAGDVTGTRLVKQGFATVAAGDMIGIEVIGTSGPTCPPLTVQLRFRPA